MLKPYVFPVPGGRYSNDWGGARSPGATGGTGRHQGTDIFAAAGTPVYAVTDGVVTKMGPSKIGGNRVWINGQYYYAHLKGFAAGLKPGARVRAGQVIGYVGNTGDAKGTPPHLHFAYDPKGGHGAGNSWGNPYEMLKRWESGRPDPVDAPAPSAEPVAAAEIEFGQGVPAGPPTPAAPGLELPGSAQIPAYRDDGPAGLWRLISPVSDEGRRFLELAGGNES